MDVEAQSRHACQDAKDHPRVAIRMQEQYALPFGLVHAHVHIHLVEHLMFNLGDDAVRAMHPEIKSIGRDCIVAGAVALLWDAVRRPQDFLHSAGRRAGPRARYDEIQVAVIDFLGRLAGNGYGLELRLDERQQAGSQSLIGVW